MFHALFIGDSGQVESMTGIGAFTAAKIMHDHSEVNVHPHVKGRIRNLYALGLLILAVKRENWLCDMRHRRMHKKQARRGQ